MGCLCDKENNEQEHRGNEKTNLYRNTTDSTSGFDRKKSPVEKLAYNTLCSSSSVSMFGYMDPDEMNNRIRLAKAQMKTVTARNGFLYFDYEFVGRILPGARVNVY